MGQGESSFYPVHGHNVYLKENGSVIERATDSRSHTVAFTKKSLVLNGLFQVRVLKKDKEQKKRQVTSHIIIGITTQNPSNIKNLSGYSSLYELQNTTGSGLDCTNDYWCIEFTSSSKSKNSISIRQPKKEIPLTEKDIVGLMLTQSGYVHLLLNGVDQEVLWNNLPTHLPLWGVVELTGLVTSIRAEYRNISSITLQEDNSKARSITPSILRPLPPIPNNDRSPSPQPPDLPHTSPATRRRPLPEKPTIPPVLVQKKTSLTLPTKQMSLESNSRQTDLQIIVHDQMQQIFQLEKERDGEKEARDELQQQVDILRMQLLQRQRDTQTAPPDTTSNSDVDISFWEISSKDLDVSEEVLGRGGWGEVRLGRFHGIKVAVKKLYSEILSPHYVSLIRREVSMMAKVRHPNLVLFIAAAFDEPSGVPMIVLELLDTSLRQAYQQKQLQSLVIKLSILKDTAAALNYLHLHKEEIIHRDVSSANILLESLADGVWRGKLSDFGSANLARLAMTAAPGAEVYTAPEVPRSTLKESAEVQRQTTKIDVYSYGVLLCEVISGEFPQRHVFQEMLRNVETQSISIRQLVESCVETDPAHRPVMKTIMEQLDNLIITIL